MRQRGLRLARERHAVLNRLQKLRNPNSTWSRHSKRYSNKDLSLHETSKKCGQNFDWTPNTWREESPTASIQQSEAWSQLLSFCLIWWWNQTFEFFRTTQPNDSGQPLVSREVHPFKNANLRIWVERVNLNLPPQTLSTNCFRTNSQDVKWRCQDEKPRRREW